MVISLALKHCAHDKYFGLSNLKICYILNAGDIWLQNITCIRRVIDCQDIFVRVADAFRMRTPQGRKPGEVSKQRKTDKSRVAAIIGLRPRPKTYFLPEWFWFSAAHLNDILALGDFLVPFTLTVPIGYFVTPYLPVKSLIPRKPSHPFKSFSYE